MDISTIGIGFDTSGLNKGTAALKANEQQANKTADSVDKTERSAKRASDAFSGLKTVLATLGLGLVAKQFIETADAATLLDARLKIATGSASEFAKAQQQIYSIAQSNNVALAATAQLYTKLADPVKALGGSTKEVGAIVDAFATSMRVGGASAQEASSATLQFAQAMASGKLSGDEFRSMAEASPRFMKALADGMGVPTGRLKEMSTEGKLTADVVGNALIKSLSQLKSEARGIPDTVGGAFQRMKNDVSLAVSEINNSSGLTLGIASLVENVRQLIPLIKNELVSAFSNVGKFIDENREALGQVWTQTKQIVADTWEVAKAGAAIVGYLASAVLQGGALVNIIQTARLIFAGLVDGIEFIGGAFATVGSMIMKHMLTPIELVVRGMGLISGAIGAIESQKSFERLAANIKDFAGAGAAYGNQIVDNFSRGNTAVGRLGVEFGKTRQAQEALATGIGIKEVTSEMARLSAKTSEAENGFKKLKAVGNSGDDKGAASKLKQQANAYLQLVESIKEKIAVNNLELSLGRKLNDSEKQSLEIQKLVATGKISAKDASSKNTITLLAEAKASDELLEKNKEYLKLLEELKREQEKILESAFSRVDSINQQAEAQENANKTFYLAKSALDELTLAQLEKSRADLEATDNVIPGYVQALDLQIAAQKRLIDAKKGGESLDKEKKALDDIAKESKKFTDELEDGVKGALYRAFESGSKFFSTFWSEIKNLFKTTTLKLVVNAVAGGIGIGGSGIASAASGVLGGGGGGLLGSIFGGGGSNPFAGVFNAQGTGIASAISGGLSAGFGGLTGSIGSLFGAAGTGTTLAGSLSAGSIALSSGNILGGLSTFAGALGPIALGISAISSLFKKKVVDSGIQGEFGGEAGFSGAAFTTTKRLFGGRKDSLSALDDELRLTLAAQFGAIKATVIEQAKSLNLGIDGVDAVRAGFRLSTAGLNEEQVKKALETELSNAADSVARAVLGSMRTFEESITRTVSVGGGDSREDTFVNELVTRTEYIASALAKAGESASETLSRLSTSLVSVNSLFRSLGAVALEASVLGGDRASKLIDLVGGSESFTQLGAVFYEKFFTEAERLADAKNSLGGQLSAIGISQDIDRAGYRTALQSAANAGNDALVASLLKLAPAFDAVATATESVNSQFKQLLGSIGQQITALEDEILGLNGGDVQSVQTAREIQAALEGRTEAEKILLLAQFDQRASLIAQRDAINANIESARKASEEQQAAAQREQAIAQEKFDLEGQYLSATGNTLALRERELKALDQSNRALKQQIYDIEDQTQALIKQAQARASLQSAIDSAVPKFFSQTETALYKASRIADQVKASGFDSFTPEQLLGFSKADIRTYVEAQLTRVDISDDQKASLVGFASSLADLQDELAGSAAQAQASATSIANSINSLFADLEAGIRRLYGSVSATTAASVSAANAYLQKVAVTGASAADQDKIRTAMEVAISGIDNKQFASSFDQDRERLRLAGVLSGILGSVPSFDVGTDYVPSDMLAKVHKGERITPARYNNQSDDKQVFVDLLRSLEVKFSDMANDLSSIRSDSKRTANAVNGRGDQPILVETV